MLARNALASASVASWKWKMARAIGSRMTVLLLVVVSLTSLWMQLESCAKYSSKVAYRDLNVFSSTYYFYGTTNNVEGHDGAIDGKEIDDDESDHYHKSENYDAVHSNQAYHPIVEYDEFYRKPVSQEVIDKKFRFEPNMSMLGEIKPLWTCSDYVSNPKERERKLVFLHIKKTGGRTLTGLINAYANVCHAAVASVDHCEDLGDEFIDGEENWSNAWLSKNPGIPCILNGSWNRSGHFLSSKIKRVSTVFLEENEIDIVMGTLPFGCDDTWKTKTTRTQIDSQYVIMLRDPVTKYISEFLSARRTLNLTSAQLNIQLRAQIQNEAMHGYRHNIYSKYLISPVQRSWMTYNRITWTDERKVNMSLSNMIGQQMVVNVLERVPESLALLQYLIDGKRDVTNIFQYFAATESVQKLLKVNHNNQTSDVLAYLNTDPTLLGQLRNILTHEQIIYDWGIKVHEAQLDRLVRMGWPSAIESTQLEKFDSVKLVKIDDCGNGTETEC